MKIAEAAKILNGLSRTAKFPEDETELKHFAQVLIEASGGDAKLAQQIVDALRKTERFFPPDAAFYEQARVLRPDPGLPTWKSPNPADFPIGCQRCRDLGAIEVSGRWERCDCESGRFYPDILLDMANRKRPAKEIPVLPPMPANPITETDILRAEAELRAVGGRS